MEWTDLGRNGIQSQWATTVALVVKTHGPGLPAAEPSVNLPRVDPKTLNLVVRIPTPARRRGRFEQAILGRFLDEDATLATRAIEDPSAQAA